MAKEAVFVVTLNPAPTEAVTVNYATRDGTAKASDGDYTATSGTLTFQPGQTTKEVCVPVQLAIEGEAEELFYLDVSWPAGSTNTVTDGEGVCTIPGGGTAPVADTYLARFNWTYDTLKADSTGFFGPQTGPHAKTVPYHSLENLIVEAPDIGHQSVSETISFWARLELWKGVLGGDWTGYQAMWTSVETNYIPSTTNQPLGQYTPASPATYAPNRDYPNQYPVAPDLSMTVGADPLYTNLVSTYGDKRMYLMHWFWDTDGAYGFHNGDGTTVQVAINSFQRGLNESSWETVTQPEWEDFNNGGGTYGYLPLFQKGKQVYSEAPYDYGKQWRYTCAPDAEARLIAASYLAHVNGGSSVSTQDSKAKRMGDYLRYALYDKYFRPIGKSPNVSDASGCHYLNSWYVSWGGEIPASGQTGSWGFRIGSSETHFGYNCVDAAWAMATNGGGYTPQSTGAGSQWETSTYRQLDLIRWLQTPEGAIAGGVTNSMNDRYETPTDGRQNATFYGMYYVYSPVWHDPPSNRWSGFQFWGMERVANLYLQTTGKTGEFNTNVHGSCGVILDRWVPWVMANTTLSETDYAIPGDLHWHSDTAIAGETITTANLEGVYEYLPTLTWPGSNPDYAAFWSGSSVPNPKLKCIIANTSNGLGEAAACAQVLIMYVRAKLDGGATMDTAVPLTSYTLRNVLDLAKGLIDRIWVKAKDDKGFTQAETRSDYSRYADPVYVPNNFTGHMPNGDPINASSTFVSIRTFMKDYPEWDIIQAHLDGGPAPVFHYHRFWHITDIGTAYAMMAKYFPDEAPGTV